MAIHEGCALPHLAEIGNSFTTSAERDTVRGIKEELAYVVEDYEAELSAADTSSDIEKNFELLDSQVIMLRAERCRCLEVLFRLSLASKEGAGIAHLGFDVHLGI